MTEQGQHNLSALSGDELLRVLSALANPHRLRIIGSLAAVRNYVSQLAREIGMSRPLLHMHLRRLEAAGLVRGTLTLSEEEGKAMRYFEVTPFLLYLTPERIAEAVRTLTEGAEGNAAHSTQSESEEG
jgi:DNA-binding transcriptional ArsR family regulator